MALFHVLTEQKIHEWVACVRAHRYSKNMYVWGTKAPRILTCLNSAFLASVQASPDETEPSGRV